jgi:hypothetical protein
MRVNVRFGRGWYVPLKLTELCRFDWASINELRPFSVGRRSWYTRGGTLGERGDDRVRLGCLLILNRRNILVPASISLYLFPLMVDFALNFSMYARVVPLYCCRERSTLRSIR